MSVFSQGKRCSKESSAPQQQEICSKPRPTVLLLFAIATIPFALTGCGSSVITPVPATLPGTYSITITGTGATTGITHAVQLTLTVTP
jgi:hypothetical protein